MICCSAVGDFFAAENEKMTAVCVHFKDTDSFFDLYIAFAVIVVEKISIALYIIYKFYFGFSMEYE